MNVPPNILATDLSYDLCSTAQWRKDWLISFSTSKTKLLKFHHDRADPKPAPIPMSGHTLLAANACSV